MPVSGTGITPVGSLRGELLRQLHHFGVLAQPLVQHAHRVAEPVPANPLPHPGDAPVVIAVDAGLARPAPTGDLAGHKTARTTPATRHAELTVLSRQRHDRVPAAVRTDRRVGARLSAVLRVVWRPLWSNARAAVRMFIHRRPRCELP